jgi:hypothetical protein
MSSDQNTQQETTSTLAEDTQQATTEQVVDDTQQTEQVVDNPDPIDYPFLGFGKFGK